MKGLRKLKTQLDRIQYYVRKVNEYSLDRRPRHQRNKYRFMRLIRYKNAIDQIKQVKKEETKKQQKIGRPALGVTRKVSLTLPIDVWEAIEEMQSLNDSSMSEVIRSLINASFERSPAAP